MSITTQPERASASANTNPAGGVGGRPFSRWWHAAFIGVPVVAGTVPVIGDGVAASSPALLVLALYPVTWLLFGRLSLTSVVARWTFQVTIVVLLFFVISLAPDTAILQALVYPFVWTMSDSLRGAIVANVVVAFAVGAGFFLGFGDEAWALPSAVSIAGLSFLFSLAFGLWITRIADWGEERSRLLDELTAAQGALAAAHRESGITTERERIGREVHDTLAQSLTGLVMLTQRASATACADRPDLDELREQLDVLEVVAVEALSEARAVVAAASAVSVDGGLAIAAARLAERFTRETGIQVTASVEANTTRELEVVLLRCAQEALANVRKHSRARTAQVIIESAPSVTRLSVLDDGVGISHDDIASSSGFGLTGMRERLALVRGSLVVETPTGGGTRLVVEVPREDQS